MFEAEHMEHNLCFVQVRWINPEIYDDVTRERAISGLCGYPMCGQAVVDTFGERLYIIRNNKVYNITERRVSVLY